jgi:hypothetical protein
VALVLKGALGALAAVLLTCGQGVAKAATQDIRTVVAPVAAMWNDEAALRRFHADLNTRFKDAPSFEELRDSERWVVVVDTAQAKWARPVAAPSGGVEAAPGDIVEVEYRPPRDAKSYAELSRVRKVVCAAASPDFNECRQRTLLGAFDAEGVAVAVPPSPTISTWFERKGMDAACLKAQSRAWCVLDAAKMTMSGLKDVQGDELEKAIGAAKAGEAWWYGGAVAGLSTKFFKPTPGLSRGTEGGLLVLSLLLGSVTPEALGWNGVFGWMPLEEAASA